MSIKVSYSTQKEIVRAAHDLKSQFGTLNPALVIFFASTAFDPASISKVMHDTFSPATVFGCSTSGELVSGAMLKNSIVAMAFDAASVKSTHIEILQNVKTEKNIRPKIKTMLGAFEKYAKCPALEIDVNKYLGLILIDGLSLSEERIMDAVGDLTNVTFIGGSAGDDLKFSATYIYAQGRVYTDAALFALLEPANGFDIIKTQSFQQTGKTLVATKVDEATRTVMEFDGQPAAKRYAEVLGTTVADVSKLFMKHPLGLMVNGEPFVRSPQRIDHGNVVFYCNIKEGMALSLLNSTDIIADTKKSIEAKQQTAGTISGIINFHCILRTLDLEQQGATDQYGKVFANIPSIGFSTYGEEYIGHINQTSTMVVFK
ncbi:MAG TPA: FIST N-terminal domain-containing protein [Bacteroidota bacterium]|nr:FIST N-terminal domain-containing protein [Bacteroidota bacterium]